MLIIIIVLIIQCNIFKTLKNTKIITDNEKGEIGNYTYELWKDYGNETKMTLLGEGKFSCSWKDVGEVLFHIGKRWDMTKTYREIGNIKVNFEFEFISNFTYSYGIYGWFSNRNIELIEFYIMENWEIPFNDLNVEKLGNIFIDGSIYDIYRKNLNQFDSNTLFFQIMSVRRQKRNKGIVSVNEHFKKWEENGVKLGKIYEVSFYAGGYKGYGSANITKNEIIIEKV